MAEVGPAATAPVEVPPPRAELGRALKVLAPDVGHLVLRRCRRLLDNYPQARRAGLTGDIIHRTTLAATTVGHVLHTGRLPTPEQWNTLSKAGDDSARDTILLADMTKLYLSWRDVTIETLQREARRLGTDDVDLAAAADVVRMGCDASLVRTAKSFDAGRRELQGRLAEEQARLAHLARHDALTGLPNRRTLFDELARAVDVGERRVPAAAVLFVDLDGFKSVNDKAGHAVGDQLLIEVARRLSAVTRADDVVARLGGDEFVVFCRNVPDPDVDALVVAERVHAALSDPVRINGTEHVASASIGVTALRRGDDPERVLSRADAAMYLAKRCGRTSHQAQEPATRSA